MHITIIIIIIVIIIVIMIMFIVIIITITIIIIIIIIIVILAEATKKAGVDLNAELREFHAEHYRAPRIRLAIFGVEDQHLSLSIYIMHNMCVYIYIYIHMTNTCRQPIYIYIYIYICIHTQSQDLDGLERAVCKSFDGLQGKIKHIRNIIIMKSTSFV